MNLTHQDKLLISKGLVLFEMSNLNVENVPIFAFIIADKNDIARLQADVKTKSSVNYNDYGRLVLSGVGVPNEENRKLATELAHKMLESDKA